MLAPARIIKPAYKHDSAGVPPGATNCVDEPVAQASISSWKLRAHTSFGRRKIALLLCNAGGTPANLPCLQFIPIRAEASM